MRAVARRCRAAYQEIADAIWAGAASVIQLPNGQRRPIAPMFAKARAERDGRAHEARVRTAVRLAREDRLGDAVIVERGLATAVVEALRRGHIVEARVSYPWRRYVAVEDA